VAEPRADYYELLGVPRDADDKTIQKAFHAAARTFHPDVSKSPEAEPRFRQLTEAYGVLSKTGPRLLYDRYGYRGRGNRGFDEKLWEQRERAPRGENVHADVVLTSFEANSGARRLVAFRAAAVCAHCDGRGTTSVPDPTCADCRGTGRRRVVAELDIARMLRLERCPRCSGPRCDCCGGRGLVSEARRLRIRIPAGVQDGVQLRVGGEGDAMPRGGVPGDLLVRVRLARQPDDPRFVRYAACGLFLFALALLVAYML
jgi:molecular chaperone DnaJ